MKYIVEHTPSERMALLDLINFYMMVATGAIDPKALPTMFVNCGEQPPVETHVGDLLVKVMDAIGVEGHTERGNRTKHPATPVPDAT